MKADLTRRRFLEGLAAASLGSCPADLLARAFTETTYWDPFVADINDADTYLRRKFRQDVTDRTTGLGLDALKVRLAEIVRDGLEAGDPWRIIKAKCFAAQALEMSIDVSTYDWFPAISVWNRTGLPIKGVIGPRAGEVNREVVSSAARTAWAKGNAEGDWNVWQDFDHSVPDWRVILKLGFPGLRDRLTAIAGATGTDGRYADPFAESVRLTADAVLGLLDRFVTVGERRLVSASGDGRVRLEKEIAALKRLRKGPPETAYETMLFIWIYFFCSEHLDGIQCRSLTELDVFLTPYYEADLAAGRTTEAEFRAQLKHFFWQWGSVANYWNQPIGLGGTKADGTTEFNHVTKIILEEMDAYAQPTPKFLVKVAPNTPEWAMDKMMDLARRHRSIAFVGEEPCARALKRWFGATDEDCRKMVLRGCYEFDLCDGVNRSSGGYVNFLKPVERMMHDCAAGHDFADWEAFKAEYLRRLAEVLDGICAVALETEKAFDRVNPACLMTLATEHALKTRKDGYANGCPRGNNTGILSAGIGTAVDALLAVKEIVYERRELTLSAFGRVLADDWKGHEALRLRTLRSKRKWGNNDPDANRLGGEIVKLFAAQVNGKPNARGGIFIAVGHSARQYVSFGEKTGATPDGRKAGDEISKNMSPTMGADTEGATALVMTLANSGTTTVDLLGDYPLDVMLHPSVCAGKRGLDLMKSIVRIFHRNGGSVVQFTVFSAEELRDAQAHPEKYENLQVRVCGWNVRWNDLTKAEQEAFICRAENIMH